ncbi:hypothetical protein [Rhodococcus qingshengii]|uniref:hypothetical protein n=1 Tax=Rhodococcus qingshengii TaxID=334542 RepID=UPI0022B2F5B2|nr:hypothetical protein [Rhodococcus qingshengii]MCZ4615193.1 hypothetical protein [Rhodococcus qingshengii]
MKSRAVTRADIPAAQFIRERTAAGRKVYLDFIAERKLDEFDNWPEQDEADFRKLSAAHTAEWKRKAIDNKKARGAL